MPDFAASADANVSFDGKRVLFAGKQAASDPWQIWELTLEDHSLRKLIGGEDDAIRPFYLPFGRLVYARRTTQGFRLEVAGKDAADALAGIDANAGRQCFRSVTSRPARFPRMCCSMDEFCLKPLSSRHRTTPELFLVYSDGSGVESYRCDHGRARWGGKQLASGDVVFTHGTSLARFTSPLAHEAHVRCAARDMPARLQRPPREIGW